MSKQSYPDVLKWLVNYAVNDLNAGFWAPEESTKTLIKTHQDHDDQLDELAKLRPVKDFGCDELDHIELIMSIEDEYEVELSDDWWNDDPSLGQLAEMVVKLSS